MANPGARSDLTKVSLYIDGKGSNAEGLVSSGGFTVRAESRIVRNPTPTFQRTRGLATLRARLIRDGVLAEADDSFYFKKDYEFTSPSTAASIVRGCQTNGLAAWKTSDGTRLGDLIRARSTETERDT
jgi:Domain of unknown function (DUF4357)